MQLELVKSKILRAEVTDAELHYEGSLAIDKGLMDRVGMRPYEKILVGNITNGERLETYAIPAPAGSRTISLNGAAAHKGKPGDLLVIMSFAFATEAEAENWEPRVVTLGEHNTQIIVERGPEHPNEDPVHIGL
ncbi:MAG: aspartate 1-decarboxylase [Opitutales bacterium]